MSRPEGVTRFLFEALDIRGAVVQLGPVWQQICAQRNYPAHVQSMLGQMCAVTAVIAANLKQTGRLTFQLSGHGPLSMLVIDCSEDLNLRAYARHETPLPAQASPAELFADGRLLMSLETENARQPYQSYVPIEGDSIAAIFEHYLAQSEQQPASLFLFADQHAASGLFLQKLPGADLRDLDGWNRVQQLAATVKPEELAGLDAATLLSRLFAEEDVRMYESRALRHDFPADRGKIDAMLRSLGEAEIRRIVAEQGEVLLEDELSNHRYHYTPEQALALFSTPTLH